jgi:hypothetical protein
MIPNLLLQMKADNKSDYTIKFTRKALTYLSKHAPLTQPEAVKAHIATMQTSDAHKKFQSFIKPYMKSVDMRKAR